MWGCILSEAKYAQTYQPMSTKIFVKPGRGGGEREKVGWGEVYICMPGNIYNYLSCFQANQSIFWYLH